jgi:hypothetical protein
MHTLGQTMGLEITREGEKPDALYIVRTGIVSIMVMGEEVMEAMHGDLIGENEILNLTQGYRRNRTCVAKTSCELCRLSSDHFLELLRSCSDLQTRCRLLVHAHFASLQDRMKMRVAPSLRERYCVAWKQVSAQIDSAEDAKGDAQAQGQAQNAAGEAGPPSVDNRDKSRRSLKLVKHVVKGASERFLAGGGDDSNGAPEGMHRVGGAGGGARLLTSRFVLRLRTVVPTSDVFGCFSNIKYAVLGVQYGGTQDCPGSRERTFTDVFSVEQDKHGVIDLEHEVAINVRHLHNSWADLPALRVVLYAVFYPDSFNPPLTGYLPNLDDPLPAHQGEEASVAEQEEPGTPPPSAGSSGNSANVAGAGIGEDPRLSSWVIRASERVFQQERLQQEKAGAGKRFSEADKAGIEALAAGHASLKLLIQQREVSSANASGCARGGCARGENVVMCKLHRRGSFSTAIELRLNVNVERHLALDSPWRRVLKAIKVLDPSRYFRNKSRQTVRDMHKRFSTLMRDVASTKQDRQASRDDHVRELTMLVKGLYAHMSEVHSKLEYVQERLSDPDINARGCSCCNACSANSGRGESATEKRVAQQKALRFVTSRPAALDVAAEHLNPVNPVSSSLHARRAQSWQPDPGAEAQRSSAAVAVAVMEQPVALSSDPPQETPQAPPDSSSQPASRRDALISVPSSEECAGGEVGAEKGGEEAASSLSYSSRVGRSGLAPPSTSSRAAVATFSAAMAMRIGDTSSDEGDDDERRRGGKGEKEGKMSAPGGGAGSSGYAPSPASPAWQEKADEFLRGNIVRNFYS